ncbi:MULTISPECIES: SphA family protein [Flavobacterium]|uniref:SphA family protein n=1 Tax=Flavobacterium TaxID=237 RepID=UPI002482052D|nr:MULTISPECIES: transporter [Flavobacterium]
MFYKNPLVPLKFFLAFLLIVSGTKLQAQGHYTGSSFNPNDYFIPPSPGWVFSLYYSYSKQDFYNNSGDKSDKFEISQSPPLSIELSQNVSTSSIIPMILYFGKGKILNARWGASLLPIANKPNASIVLDFYSGQNNAGEQVININSFGLGDFYIQPIWLTWEKENLATSISYGLWMPTGKYKTNSPENVGLGYWSHNFRIASRIKPIPKISFTTALTYELNSKQKGIDYIEGSHLTYDISSSYNFTMGHEIGLYGYSTWQTSNDKGEKGSELKDKIYGIGAYGSYWFIPGKIGVLARFTDNFGIRNRYAGLSVQLGINYLLL